MELEVAMMMNPTGEPPEAIVRESIRCAMAQGANGTQILTWVMEETANEVDYMEVSDEVAIPEG